MSLLEKTTTEYINVTSEAGSRKEEAVIKDKNDAKP